MTVGHIPHLSSPSNNINCRQKIVEMYNPALEFPKMKKGILGTTDFSSKVCSEGFSTMVYN